MSQQLPAPEEIAAHYDTLLRDLGGEYIESRWGNSATKRRHYAQTEIALRLALGRVSNFGDVLEIGSGPAVWTPLFLRPAKSVDLLDISQEMLAAAKKRLAQFDSGAHASKVTYTRGDFLLTAPPRAKYDTIVSARAFEYMSDKQAFVSKCFSLLRPGGRLIVITKNKHWRDLERTAAQYRGVPRDQIPVETAMQLDLASAKGAEDLLRTAGFSDPMSFPVVIGSYDRPFSIWWDGGLWVADVIHHRVFTKPMSSLPRWVDSLTESFVFTGTRPQ
jgi:SAM-dependent methyltransferase